MSEAWQWSFGEVPPAAADDGDVPPSQARELAPGARFAGYEVLGVLGQGGMGRVLRVRGPAGRELALKLLHGPFDERRRARFQREGELASQLKHPGLVSVLGGGEMNGVPYLVYELVEGARDLEEASRALPLRGKVELVREAARAVAHAHEAGIVHRDLKPANILLDREGRVRVTDFGLGKGERSVRLTKTGVALGTPSYMAPEQLTGEATGPPSDVWALGVILFQAGCGRLPFGGGTWAELHAQVLAGSPDWPEGVEVPAALRAVISRALSKRAEERYADASALAGELDAWLERGTSRAETARRRRWLVALALALLALCGGLAVAVGPREPRPRIPGPASHAPPVGPEPSQSLDDAEHEAASAAWKRIRARGNLDEQLRQAYLWLEAHPHHEAAEEARALVRARAWERPLFTGEHPPLGDHADVEWLDARTLFSYGAGVRRWLPLEPRPAHGEWPSPADVGSLRRLPGGDLVLEWNDRLERRVSLDAPPTWRAQPEGTAYLALSPGGDRLVCASTRGALHVLRTHDGSSIRELEEGEARRLRGLCFDVSGERIYVVRSTERGLTGSDASLAVLDVESGRRLVEVPVPPILPRAFDISPAGDRLVVGTYGGRVLVYDAETLALRTELSDPDEQAQGLTHAGGAHAGLVHVADFLPDGRRLVTGAGAGIAETAGWLKVWDLERGARLRPPLRLPQAPWDLAISPDGRLLALGFQEGLVQVWVLDPP